MSQGRYRWVRDVLETFVIAFVLALLVRTYVIGSFQVVGDSMKPTLLDGEWVFIWRVAYLRAAPDRGDVIVFRYPLDPDRDFVKRVIALPGEEIEIRGGQIYIDGRFFTEPAQITTDRSTLPPTTVPEGHVFVLGDNRRLSEDSRYFGSVPLDNIKGEVFLIYWPPGHIGWLSTSRRGP